MPALGLREQRLHPLAAESGWVVEGEDGTSRNAAADEHVAPGRLPIAGHQAPA